MSICELTLRLPQLPLASTASAFQSRAATLPQCTTATRSGFPAATARPLSSMLARVLGRQLPIA